MAITFSTLNGCEINEVQKEMVKYQYSILKNQIEHHEMKYNATKDNFDSTFLSMHKERLNAFKLALSCMGIEIIDGDSNGN